MSIAFTLLVALVATAPVLAFTSGTAETVVVALIAVLSLLVATWTIPADELARAGKAIGRVWLILAAPAVWMLLQLVPLPPGTLTHPIWVSAAAALPELRFGHITLSLGDTSRALSGYLGVAVLVLASAMAVVNRRRAELCLAALIVAAAVVAGLSLAFTGAGLRNETGAAAGVLGCILSCAGIRDFVERRWRQRAVADKEAPAGVWLLLCSVIGLGVSFSAVLALSQSAWIAALLGSLTFVAVVLANAASSLRGAHHVILPLVVLAAATAFAARSSTLPAGSSILVELSGASSEARATATRLAGDTGWLGAGAGTYADAARTYQELGQPVQAAPPSTAVKLAVEWGAAAPFAASLAALWLAALLIGWTVQRGRDAFYSAAAAGCVVGLTIQAGLDASLLDPAISLLVAVIVGLGLGQAYGRSAQR